MSSSVLFQSVKATRSALDNMAISNGKAYFVQDTEQLFFDYDNTRTEIRDIIILDTIQDKNDILAPKNKFYFVVENSTLYLYRSGKWYSVASSATDASSKQVVTINAEAVVLGANAIYKSSISGETQISFEGWTRGQQDSLTLYLDVVGSSTLILPANVLWKNDVEPLLEVGGTYILEFKSIDGGATIYGSIDKYV